MYAMGSWVALPMTPYLIGLILKGFPRSPRDLWVEKNFFFFFNGRLINNARISGVLLFSEIPAEYFKSRGLSGRFFKRGTGGGKLTRLLFYCDDYDFNIDGRKLEGSKATSLT